MLKAEYIMRERGATQTDIAMRSKINRVTVNRFLRGKDAPNEQQAQAIAAALDWPTDSAAELFEEIEVK